MADEKYRMEHTPEDLDTALDLIDELALEISNKVDKIAGKGLSTNDFTDAYKGKVDKNEAGIISLLNRGEKNLAPNVAVSGTVSDVAFTVYEDGSVKAHGTANAATWFCIAENVTLKAGAYIISGGEVVSGTVNVRVVFSPSTSASAIIADSNGAASNFTLNTDTTANIYIRMSTGRAADNVMVYPMICTKADWDISHGYAPYKPSGVEIIASTGYGTNVDSTKAKECDYSFTVDADIVTLQFRLVLNVAIPVTSTFAMIMVPKGYRPPVKTVWGTGYANNKTVCMWCNTAGEIRMRVDEEIPANSTIAGTIVYSRNGSTWKTLPTTT